MGEAWMWISRIDKLIPELVYELKYIDLYPGYRDDYNRHSSILNLKHSVGLSTIIQELIK